ncbi:MAG: hypothetical protein HOD72_03300 [Opitutae bacterium]|nr:hypothetical protein [Opitutae bacterium]MBT4223472.1 hypothetical protein [Opitutae bacterium]MBT5377754.1 hypothetical protein [Opitutae bacterium]MBT7852417.1 hypothetical protein [Opitutae bacterium]
MNFHKQILTVLFIFATLMGPGPGLYLANNLAAETSMATVMGIPVIYAWVAFWFMVQAGVIMVASQKIWKAKDEPDA